MKRQLTIAVSALLVAASFSLPATAADNDNTCDLPGSGTTGDPWEIDSAADMLEIGINDCISTFNSSHHYELTADVDLAGSWTPVELKSTGTVSFNGNGYAIRGVGTLSGGFFSQIENATVESLTLEIDSLNGTNFVGGLSGDIRNSNITDVRVYIAGSVSGSQTVGGFAGSVAGSTISASLVRVGGVVNAASYGAGGIGDFSDSTINGLSVEANVVVSGYGGGAIAQWTPSGNDSISSVSYRGSLIAEGYVGGIAGYVFSATSSSTVTIDDSYVLGSLGVNGSQKPAGFIGQLNTSSGGYTSNITSLTVNDSYISAAFTNTSGAMVSAGSYGGYRLASTQLSTNPNIIHGGSVGTLTTNDVFYDTDATPGNYEVTGTAQGKTAAQMKTKSTYTNASWNLESKGSFDPNTDSWAFDDAVVDNAGYPFLGIEYTLGAFEEFTLSFNAVIGSGSLPGNRTARTSWTVPADPSLYRSGFDFDGWNSRSDGTGTSFQATDSVLVAGEDRTLYAQWNELYDLSFDGNNEDSGAVSTIAENNSPTVPGEGNLLRSGFDFAGWNTQANGRGTSYAEGDTLSLAADETLYAQWTADVSASLSNPNPPANTDVSVEATVSGVSLASDSSKVYEVSLAATNGTFTLSDATLADCDGDGDLTEAATGVYCSPGKTDFTEVSGLKFRSNTTESLNTVLDAVTFNIADSESSDLSLSISEVSPSQNIYKFGNRYYEYVADSGITATAAETAAEAKTFFGLSGYLVNITSEAENDFVSQEAQAQSIWIGASDRDSEGNWAWIGGPEEGQVFFKDPDDVIPNAATYNLDFYNSWASDEPNDGSGEDYAVTNWDGTVGKWNDLDATNSTNVSGYLVEYGDGTEVAALSSASASITAARVAASTPYAGPIIHGAPNGEKKQFSSSGTDNASFEGERLGTISKAFVDGKEAEIVSISDKRIEIIVPAGLTPGTYDLYVESSIGNLTYLDAITVSGYGDLSAWTTRISDTQAKVYVKYPTVGEKLRISHQTGGSGEYNTVYVKTTASEDDPSMIVNEHGSYIVRTIDLENINRIRVTVGDQRLVQVRYNR